jgi:hypothetical protein
MFRVCHTTDTAVDVVQEKPIEPRMERSVAFRIEQLEERIAPASFVKLLDKATPL